MGPLSPKNSGSNTETGRCPSERSTSRQSRVLLQKKIRRLHRKDSKGKSQRSLRLRRNPPFKGLHRKIKDGQRSKKRFWTGGPRGERISRPKTKENTRKNRPRVPPHPWKPLNSSFPSIFSCILFENIFMIYYKK